MNPIVEFASSLWNKYIVSYEGVATLLAIVVITIKLVANQKVTNLHFKKTIVSIPGEITSLVMGFLLSAMVANSAQDMGIMALIVLAFLVILFQYSVEHHLDDKLSGDLKPRVLILILTMYITSIALYHAVVFGGITNAQG